MSSGKLPRRFLTTASALAIMGFSPLSAATEQTIIAFTATAQEISQLFWLAETANTCGWATRGETECFEQFAVRSGWRRRVMHQPLTPHL